MMQDMAKREKNSREKAIELLQNHDRVCLVPPIPTLPPILTSPLDGRKDEIRVRVKDKRIRNLHNTAKVIIEIDNKQIQTITRW